MDQPTRKDVLELIRKNGGLYDWTDFQIYGALDKSLKCYAFTYTTNEQNKLDGVALGEWETLDHIHVIYSCGNFQVFLNHLKDHFPDCNLISFYRDGEYREHNLICQTQKPQKQIAV